MIDDSSYYVAEPEVRMTDAVRANRLTRAYLTGNTAEIILIMNAAIAEGSGSLSRLAMVLAADLALFMTMDNTEDEAVFVIDGVLAHHLRDGE